MAGKPKSAADAVRGAELAAAWALVASEQRRIEDRIAMYEGWSIRPPNVEQELAALRDERASLLADAWRGRSTPAGVARAHDGLLSRARRVGAWTDVRRDLTHLEVAERLAEVAHAVGASPLTGKQVRAELLEASVMRDARRGTGINVAADSLVAERLGLCEGKTIQRARRGPRPSISTIVHVQRLDREGQMSPEALASLRAYEAADEMASRDPGQGSPPAVDGQPCPPAPASTQLSPASAPAASAAARPPSKRSNASPTQSSRSSARPSKRRPARKRSR